MRWLRYRRSPLVPTRSTPGWLTGQSMALHYGSARPHPPVKRGGRTQMNANGQGVVITEAVRTPIGRGHPEKGYYKDTHANELLGKCYTELLDRSGVEPAAVEDVLAGCVQQVGEQSWNVGRNAWLQAGLPETTPAT